MSPQAEYEVAMIEAFLKPRMPADLMDQVPDWSVKIWRICKTAKRPVKDDSWKK